MTRQKQSSDDFILALTIWREARGENAACRTGVGFCIINRVKRPSWWGNSIYSVATKKWQFSSLTDPKDRQLAIWPKEDDPVWIACFNIATDIIDGKLQNPVPGADSYFDISIPDPNWATSEIFVRQIGRIKFYNIDRDTEKEAL